MSKQTDLEVQTALETIDNLGISSYDIHTENAFPYLIGALHSVIKYNHFEKGAKAMVKVEDIVRVLKMTAERHQIGNQATTIV